MAPTLLEFPPVYCSSCWNADPSRVHIDFRADNDQGYGNDPNNKIPYDNLQICDTCVKAAAALVGMVDGATQEQKMAEQQVFIDRLSRELRQARTFADNMESAFENRPEHGPIRIDHRRKPRQIKEPVNG